MPVPVKEGLKQKLQLALKSLECVIEAESKLAKQLHCVLLVASLVNRNAIAIEYAIHLCYDQITNLDERMEIALVDSLLAPDVPQDNGGSTFRV